METLKVKHDNPFGYMIINKCDLTDDMQLYIEPSDDSETEEKPVVTPAKKRAAAKG